MWGSAQHIHTLHMSSDVGISPTHPPDDTLIIHIYSIHIQNIVCGDEPNASLRVTRNIAHINNIYTLRTSSNVGISPTHLSNDAVYDLNLTK